MEDNLKAAGRSVSWLEGQLHSVGIGQKSEVFYAGCNQQGAFFACRGERISKRAEARSFDPFVLSDVGPDYLK